MADSLPSPSLAERPKPTSPTAPQNPSPKAKPGKEQVFARFIKELQQSDQLAIQRSATQLVFAEGDLNAKIMIIGEGPGAEEDRQGRPFVGPSGQLLDKMLQAIELPREACMISNLYFWRPPGNRTPSDEELSYSLTYVRQLIALVQPEILFSLGALACKHLTQNPNGIMRQRGHWQPLRSDWLEKHPALAKTQLLPSLHPAFLLRRPEFKRQAWQDLQSLQQAIQSLPQNQGA